MKLTINLKRKRPSRQRRAWLAATGLGLGLVAIKAVQRLREADLHGQTVVITGGTRGLGFLLAREFARQGCRIVICARDEGELDAARQRLTESGAEVLAVPCDVSDRRQVEHLIAAATSHFGQVDILVNNAGIMQVGPVESMALSDFERSLGVMYWGPVYATLAVLPQMRARGAGRIVNITSIAGKVPVPHLLPYDAAKSAAVGFSEGLRAELAGTGIVVTTIVPGLMRTGSFLKASYKGEQQGEFGWFAPLGSLPAVSIDAERAARQVVRAVRRGEAERTLGVMAVLLTRLHGLLPGVTTDMMGMASRWILPAGTKAKGRSKGQKLARRVQGRAMRLLTAWGRASARRFQDLNLAPRRASA